MTLKLLCLFGSLLSPERNEVSKPLQGYNSNWHWFDWNSGSPGSILTLKSNMTLHSPAQP